MNDFEKETLEVIKKAFLKQIGDCRFVEYHHPQKKSIPQDIIERIWNEIDWNEVVKTVSSTLKDSIAAALVNEMLTAAKTDAKKVLSIEGVRAKLRATAYPKVLEAIENSGDT